MASEGLVAMKVNNILNGTSAGEKREGMGDRSPPSVTREGPSVANTGTAPPSEQEALRRASERGEEGGRRRQPWEGEGFSLPRRKTEGLPASANQPAIPSQQASTGQGPTCGSPPPPSGHKYSTSRGSLSSLNSSSNTTNSGFHSRGTSLSTLGESQTYNNFFSEPQPFATSSAESPTLRSSFITSQPARRPTTDLSPGQRPEVEASRMADHAEAFGNPVPEDGDQDHQTRVQRLRNETIDLTGEHRPDSPTDAVMNYQRAPAEQSASSNESSVAEHPTNASQLPAQQETVYIDDHVADIAKDENRHYDASQSLLTLRSEVRPGYHNNPPPVFRRPGDPPQNPPSANQVPQSQAVGIDLILINHAVPARWDTVQDLMDLVDFRMPQVCKFMGTCTLHLDGSEPNFRKAVSHIFGRNKSCTRQIPDGVFIVCCRKHYQRGRYRNAHEYAARMAGMVEIQVLRIQFWSNLNEMAGTAENGILRGWTIVLRRREQQRIEEATRHKASQPRANSGAGAEEELEDGDDEDADPSSANLPQATSGGPVPAWLLAEVRSGHTTESIQIVVARIRTELENGTLLVFPDIEILPSIEGENAKPKYTKKAKEGKKATPKKPAGKQNARRQSDLDEEEDEEDAGLAGNHKQQRRSHPSAIPGANALAHFAPRNTGYTVPDMRPMQFPYGTTPSGPLPSPGFYNGSHHGAETAYRAKRPHQRSATMSWPTSTFQPNASTGGYNPPPRPFYPVAPEPALAYDVPWNREHRNQGNADVNTSQPGTSSAYSSSYGFQQQPTDTSYYGYPTYPSSSAAAHGTDVQGGPPPTSAAKHMRSRNRSTPVMPGPRSTGFGMDASQDGYNYDTTSFYGQVTVPRQQGYATTSRAPEYNGQIAVPRGQPYHNTQSYPEAQQAYQPTQQYQSTQNGPEFTTTQTSNPIAPTGYEGYEGYDSRR